MNIKKTIVLTIIMILFINIVFSYKVLAISNGMSAASSFLNAASNAENQNNVINENALKTASSNIYNILLGIGIAVAVIVGAALGISFIFSSVEGKAKISEALVPYIVGCFVVFGAFGIWKIVVDIGNSMDDTPTTTQSQGVQGRQRTSGGQAESVSTHGEGLGGGPIGH